MSCGEDVPVVEEGSAAELAAVVEQGWRRIIEKQNRYR